MATRGRHRGEKHRQQSGTEKRRKGIGLAFVIANGAIVALKLGIRWFFIWKIADTGMDSVTALTAQDKLGQFTDFFTKVLSPENVKEWIQIASYVIGAGGFGYGAAQRGIRKRSDQERERAIDLQNGNDDEDEDEGNVDD